METDLPREQEQSIKERKHLLYEDDPAPAAGDASRKPFRLYLNDTPAAPLPGGVKAILWAVGAVVLALLLASMYRAARGKPRPEKAGLLPPATHRAQHS